MEYDCHTFLKYLVFQTKNLVFQIKDLVFRLETLDSDEKAPVFQIKNLKCYVSEWNAMFLKCYEISSEITSISKKV